MEDMSKEKLTVTCSEIFKLINDFCENYDTDSNEFYDHYKGCIKCPLNINGYDPCHRQFPHDPESMLKIIEFANRLKEVV